MGGCCQRAGNFHAASLPRECPAEGFDAADLAEGLGTVVAEASVADLEAAAGCAAVDFTIEDDAGAEAGAAGEVDKPGLSNSAAPAEFGEATGGGVVLDSGWKAKAVVEGIAQGNMVPAGEVRGRQDDAALGIEGAADACSEGGDLRVGGDKVRGVGAKIIDHWAGAAAGEGGPLGSREDLAVAVADDGGTFGAADVQAEE